jgi:hypothetical protein
MLVKIEMAGDMSEVVKMIAELNMDHPRLQAENEELKKEVNQLRIDILRLRAGIK